MNREEWASFAAGVVAGAAIGGVVALLVAPKSGAETRALIKEKAEEEYDMLKSRAEEGLDMVKDEVASIKGKVRDKVCGDSSKDTNTTSLRTPG